MSGVENKQQHQATVLEKTLDRDWRRHIVTYSKVRPHECLICHKGFVGVDGLKNHICNPKEGETYREIDWVDFTQEDTKLKGFLPKRREHMYNVGGKSCELCGLEFRSPCFLRVHLRKHTKEKPYICEFCGKLFSRKSIAKTHLLVHTGERPYPCVLCSRAFSLRKSLELHVQVVHRDERPYSCKICNKKFPNTYQEFCNMSCNTLKVLDGGLATELIKLGHDLDKDPLWSARLLYTNPSSVVQVHTGYLEAGAEVITSASYQATIEGFVQYLQTSVSHAEELIGNSVTLAQQAREKFYTSDNYDGTEVLIAGSVGPYGVVLADGSEYNGRYVENMSVEELMNWHRPKVKSLVRASCDVLAFETIPSVKEGVALMQLLKEFPGVNAWLSFSCQSPHETAHGEKFSTALQSCLQVSSADQLVAIGANCCPPECVASLMKEAAPHRRNIPLLVYPNSGETFASGIGWAGKSTSLHSYIKEWLQLGVQWFGGCCRTSPEDIVQIKKILLTEQTNG